jgi:hypothetical protein
VVDPHDPPLEPRPDVLHALSMNVARSHVGFGMIHGLMRELRTVEPEIRRKLIAVDFGTRFRVSADKVGQTAGANARSACIRTRPDVRSLIVTTGILLAAPRPRFPLRLPPT